MVFKFPKPLGGCADELYKIRERRLAAQKVVDEIQEQETALENHIIEVLPKSEASGVAGKVAQANIEMKHIPTVDDWDKFRTYIVKHKAWDMITKRVGSRAILDRMDAGETVPGIKMFNKVTVKLRKL